MSRCIFSLWALLILMLGIQPTNSLTITGVNNGSAPINTNASFNCETNNSNLLTWVVVLPQHPDRSYDSRTQIQLDELNRRGIFVDTASASLTVLASEENNNSQIYCRIFHPLNSEFSETLNLTVLGPPSPPEVRVHFISVSEVLLEWEEPFSWEEHKVKGYHISQVSSQSSESFNTTNTSHSYSNSSGTVRKSCQNVTFNISAYSDLGLSEPATIITGLPKIPEEFGMVNHTRVRFSQRGYPEITVTVEPPVVCSYQTVNLTLNVEREDMKGVLATETKTYQGTSGPLDFTINGVGRLKLYTNYNFTIVANTAVGNTSYTFNKEFRPPDFPTDPPRTATDWKLPVAVGVAALVLVLVVIFFIFICCCVYYKRTKSVRITEVVNSRNAMESCKGDLTYEHIEPDYQTIPARNPYHVPQQPLPPARQTRADSPYQTMSSANPSPSQNKQFNVFHDKNKQPVQHQYSSTPHNTSSSSVHPPPNNGMYVTPGGTVLYSSNRPTTSASLSEEGEYTTMNSAGNPASQLELAHHGVTLPESALPRVTYRLSEC